MSIKTGDKSYFKIDKPVKVNGKMYSPNALLLLQIQNNYFNPEDYINSLSDIVTRIDLSIYDNYHQRESQINQYNELIKNVTANTKRLLGKNKSKLIKNTNGDIHKSQYYIFDGNKVIPVDKELFNQDELNNAESYNINAVIHALKDDRINEFAESYQQLKESWKEVICE